MVSANIFRGKQLEVMTGIHQNVYQFVFDTNDSSVIEVRMLDKRSNGDMEGNTRWLDSKGTLCIHVAVANFHTFSELVLR